MKSNKVKPQRSEMERLMGFNTYPVKWVCNYPYPELSVGICQFTNKIFTIDTNPIAPFIIQDIMIGDKDSLDPGCEEAKRCCCISCPHNKISLKEFIDYKKWDYNDEDIKVVEANIEVMNKELTDLKLTSFDEYCLIQLIPNNKED